MPAQDLAGDHPGVAAGAHQRAEAHRVGDRRRRRRPGPARSASSSAALTVASMLVPVSPSGTGNTLRALISSTFASRLATALRNAARNPAPSHDRRGHQATSDPLPARSEGPGSSRRGLARRRRGRRLVDEPADPDLDPVGLATRCAWRSV